MCIRDRFTTLVLGTGLCQISGLLDGQVAAFLLHLGQLAIALTGAGIGIGMACRLEESSLAALSAAIAGTVGAFAKEFASGALFQTEGISSLAEKTEPLGAFFAAFAAIEPVSYTHLFFASCSFECKVHHCVFVNFVNNSSFS